MSLSVYRLEEVARPLFRTSDGWRVLLQFIRLINCTSLEYLTNTLPEVQQEPIRHGHVDGLQEYNKSTLRKISLSKYIFLKVENWEKFEESDIERNQIEEARNMVTIPNFVTTFEWKLVRKPLLHHDVRCFVDLPVCCSILMVSVGAYCTADVRRSWIIFWASRGLDRRRKRAMLSYRR